MTFNYMVPSRKMFICGTCGTRCVNAAGLSNHKRWAHAERKPWNHCRLCWTPIHGKHYCKRCIGRK